MKKVRKFTEYLRRSFIGYTAILIFIIFCSFLFMTIFNYRLVITNANDNCNVTVSDFILNQYTTYQANIEFLADDATIKKAFIDNKKIYNASRILYDFSLKQQINANFTLLDSSGEIILSSLYKENQLLFKNSAPLQDMLANLKINPKNTYVAWESINYSNGQKSTLRFAHAVLSDTQTIIGYIIFDLRENSLSEFLRDKDADIILICDQFNNILFSTNTLLIDTKGKYNEQSDPSTFSFANKSYYVKNTPLTEQNIQIITMISVHRQNQIFLLSAFFLFIVSLLILFLVRLLAKKVADRNAFFLDELLQSVSECRKGNTKYSIPLQPFDEFATLYHEFNNIMKKVQDLIRHNAALAERKRYMEVKQLEAQFNPHFVFNILEALRYQIFINPQQASQMIVAFANLLRYSVHYGNSHVQLKTDVAYVEDYLKLQKLRYGDRLTYKIDIASNLLTCYIPKLLIQPLIENSIIHTMDNQQELILTITGTKTANNELLLTITDDGPGIAPDKLIRIRQTLQDDSAMPEHIGLYNTHRALQLLYGAPYGLTINSALSQGTSISLTIPLNKEDAPIV